jgi:type IV secretory pathway VirJ component
MKSIRMIFAAAVALLFAACSTLAPRPTDAAIADLPLRELVASKEGPYFAILLTGDGGWRHIDVQLTRHLVDEGVSVIGFETPSYFSKTREPEEAAVDLERVIRHYSEKWSRPRVVLIGYSRGADVLPFMATRLSPEVLDQVSAIALLGLEGDIEFRYRPPWLETLFRPHDREYAVAPEVEKLRGKEILCFYGIKDKGSICRSLPAGLVKAIPEPGAHHFAGNYRGIARDIVAALPKL